MKVLRNEHPFVVELDDRGARFHFHPGSGSLALMIVAGAGVLFGVNGAVQLAMSHVAVGAALITVGVAFALVGSWLWRRRKPPGVQTHTLEARELRDPSGAVLASAADLRSQVRIAWTDGMGGLRLARVVSLRWPKGSLPIFKSYDKREIAEIRRALANHGVN